MMFSFQMSAGDQGIGTKEEEEGDGFEMDGVGVTLFPPLFNLKFYPSFCFLCDILDSLCSQLS